MLLRSDHVVRKDLCMLEHYTRKKEERKNPFLDAIQQHIILSLPFRRFLFKTRVSSFFPLSTVNDKWIMCFSILRLVLKYLQRIPSYYR